jgi:hypothetical protein
VGGETPCTQRLSIVAALGDRASNEDRGREILVEDDDVKFNLPCIAHGLHNMVNEILKSHSEFTRILEDAVAIVKELMSKKTVRAVFTSYLTEAKVRELCLFSFIRWGTSLVMFTRLLMAQRACQLFWTQEILTDDRFGDAVPPGSVFIDKISARGCKNLST